MTIEEYLASQVKAQRDLVAAQAETVAALKDIAASIKDLIQAMTENEQVASIPDDWSEAKPAPSLVDVSKEEAVEVEETDEEEETPDVIPDTVHDGVGLIEDCVPMGFAPAPNAKVEAITLDTLRELCAQLSSEQGPAAVFSVLSAFGERRLTSIPEEAWGALKDKLEHAISSGEA